MAIISKLCTLAPDISFALNYNDVTMKLVSLNINNSSNRIVYFEITSPTNVVGRFSAGMIATYNIAAVQRPDWYWSITGDPERPQVISGIDWRACPE